MEKFKHIYIVVPKLVNSGPVKGAIALYNLLKENHQFVFLITLKKAKENKLLVNTNRINIISLEKEKNFF